ncbi:MAG: Hsp20 family protein [Rickettsiales bacterium]|nr:Hsp20 family protein [Rickettsiales bacterium]
MTTALSFAPLFRRSVGFDHFDELFNRLSETDDSSLAYPPYNIEKHNDNDYTITMAVAGFSDKDLNITLEKEELKISGRIEAREEEDKVEYLHRGIATRAFERTFRLADYMRVQSAEHKDGLLRVLISRIVPEEAKPRMIPINAERGNDAKLIEGKAKKLKS